MPVYKSEAQLQSRCYTEWTRKYPNERGQLFLIYNNPPNAIVAGLLKSMGLRRGVSDMVYFGPGRSLWWMEFKLPGKEQSKEQEAFEHMCKEWGFGYLLVDSELVFWLFMQRIHGEK